MLFLISFSLQINLSEYRSRVRKPPAAEPRKDSSSDPPPLPSASSSFLPPSFTPSHLTPPTYSLLPTPSGGGLLGEAPPPPPPPPPQFEPVSPDECEPAPLHTEGGYNTYTSVQWNPSKADNLEPHILSIIVGCPLWRGYIIDVNGKTIRTQKFVILRCCYRGCPLSGVSLYNV